MGAQNPQLPVREHLAVQYAMNSVRQQLQQAELRCAIESDK